MYTLCSVLFEKFDKMMYLELVRHYSIIIGVTQEIKTFVIIQEIDNSWLTYVVVIKSKSLMHLRIEFNAFLLLSLLANS